jgi:hypothetical protein
MLLREATHLILFIVLKDIVRIVKYDGARINNRSDVSIKFD